MGQIKQSSGWKKDCAINIEKNRKKAGGREAVLHQKRKTEVDKLQTPRASIPRGVIIIKKSKRKKKLFLDSLFQCFCKLVWT